jgi:hypothetical protein
MKSFIIRALVLMFLIGFSSCKKDISDCTPVNPVCAEIAPTNELCAAFFTRWFYDKSTNSCKEISYSGCSQKGFATKAECEACKCK